MSPSPSPPSMSVDEIKRVSSSLEKALKEEQPSKNVVAILERLEAGVQATADLLRTTRIGFAVNRLKSNADPGVSSTAARITQKWKDTVGRTKADRRPIGSKPTGVVKSRAPSNGNRSTSSNTRKVPRPKTQVGTPQPAPVNPQPHSRERFLPQSIRDRRNADKDMISFSGRTGIHQRNQCMHLLYNGLANTSKADSAVIEALAVDIEKESWKRHGGAITEEYCKQIRSLYQILHNASNPTLRHEIIDGTITAYDFINKPPQTFLSPERQAEIAKIQKMNMDGAMIPKEVKAVSNMLTCPKCQAKNVSYSQAQTRSADEPMTNFCECGSCGNRWKFC